MDRSGSVMVRESGDGTCLEEFIEGGRDPISESANSELLGPLGDGRLLRG
jgi:hypothetical protein